MAKWLSVHTQKNPCNNMISVYIKVGINNIHNSNNNVNNIDNINSNKNNIIMIMIIIIVGIYKK